MLTLSNWSPMIFNPFQCYRRTDSVLFILLPISRDFYRLLCIEYVYLDISLNFVFNFFDIRVLCVNKRRCLNIDVLVGTHSSMRDHVGRNNSVWPENNCKKQGLKNLECEGTISEIKVSELKFILVSILFFSILVCVEYVTSRVVDYKLSSWFISYYDTLASSLCKCWCFSIDDTHKDICLLTRVILHNEFFFW